MDRSKQPHVPNAARCEDDAVVTPPIPSPTKRRRPWRAGIARGVLSILVGALVTVAVAWAPRMRYRPVERTDLGNFAVVIEDARTNERLACLGHHLAMSRAVESDFTESLRAWRIGADSTAKLASAPPAAPRWARFDPPLSVLRAHVDALAAVGELSRWTYASGWPMHAMRARTIGISGKPGPIHQESVGSMTFDCPEWLDAFVGAPSIALPLEPVPMGFAVDTCAYGAVVFALLSLLGAARRRRRRRRGLCGDCAYGPLTGGTCPECGAARP